jgi:2-polyprenyl-3-methyl-5-hydroxy-6-metoxy-1,4-benzoquinol methylase
MNEYSGVVQAEGYFKTERKEILDFLPDDLESILEIGCGSGSFGRLVKNNRDVKYVGVELVESVAEQARSYLDEVVVCNIESSHLDFLQGSFDCLICNDVLEHLVDPWRVLKELVEYVRPGGYVVLSLPNVRFSEVVKDLVVRKKWEYRDQGVLDRTHLRFFTETSIVELCESAGLSVIKIKGINPVSYAWRLRLLNIMLLGTLSDMRFMQYGCLCRLPFSDELSDI